MVAGGGDSDPFSFERTRSYTLPSPTPFILSSYPFFLPSSSGFVFSGGPRSALERWPHVYGSWRPWVSRRHPPANGETMERLGVRRLEAAMEVLVINHQTLPRGAFTQRVNGSGQFVGVSEMLGLVDFNKDMDLGQLDKCNGFFPVKWHVIKDVPNPQLRHITLENNDNRPVTFTRDTQEVGLNQGIEMLNIFKSYSAKTSILDDFNFYENREKSLKTKWSGEQAPSPTEIYSNHDFAKNLKTGEMTAEARARPNGASDPTSSLVNLTKNLSFNSHPASSSKKRNSHPPKNMV